MSKQKQCEDCDKKSNKAYQDLQMTCPENLIAKILETFYSNLSSRKFDLFNDYQEEKEILKIIADVNFSSNESSTAEISFHY